MQQMSESVAKEAASKGGNQDSIARATMELSSLSELFWKATLS